MEQPERPNTAGPLSDLEESLAAVANRLLALAVDDLQLREQLRSLAEAVLRATAAPPPPAETGKAAGREAEQAEASSSTEIVPTPETPTADVPAPEVLPELTLGRSPAAGAELGELSLPARWATDETDLALIEERCSVKAEAARWAARRRAMLESGLDFTTEIAPRDRAIIAKAKTLPDCFLWMCHRDSSSPEDDQRYEAIGGCFDAVAAALAALRRVESDPDLTGELERLLNLLAEAQSALRAAIVALDGPTDSDQTHVFNWIKRVTSERKIFIERHMRVDDPADCNAWAQLAERIEAFAARLEENQRRGKQRRKLLGKVRHKASLIADDPTGSLEQWSLLISVVDELINEGLPPSNRDLRDLLIPIIDDLPELPELPQSFQQVLREIDRYLASPAAYDEPKEQLPPQYSEQVQQVAQLLGGRSLLLIGGDRRPESQQALVDALGLRELLWIETRQHESISGFEPYIARPDVAAVLLAIRWSSHSFADAKEFCDRHGKPLVRLPAGYNPNQVAAQILAQCSERLRMIQAARDADPTPANGASS